MYVIQIVKMDDNIIGSYLQNNLMNQRFFGFLSRGSIDETHQTGFSEIYSLWCQNRFRNEYKEDDG